MAEGCKVGRIGGSPSLDLSVGLRDFESGPEEGLCSHCAEANNQVRTNCLQFRVKPCSAYTDLFYAGPLMEAVLASVAFWA
jgi:hypothetical protein